MDHTANIVENRTESWLTALDSREDLSRFGSNAIGLFALALRFDIDDLESTGVASIVDGGNDKKNDLIFIDEESGIAVVVQAYFTRKRKDIAPANKASDLNTAATWLLSVAPSELPSGIKAHAERLREGIRNGAISRLYFWYVHNCTESQNVQEELDAASHTLRNALNQNFKNSSVKVFVKEVGSSTLAEWYLETQSPIAVNETFEFSCPDGFEVNSEKWNAFVAALPATDLYKAYKNHNIKLFSANIRDYLGARTSDSNINNGIANTIQKTPENFWVFNNGVTAITHSISFDKKKKTLKVQGLAIVNGAQTTGAIGSINTPPSNLAKVLIRFVAVTNSEKELIHDIVRYNNSQNQVSAADFRSTDNIQKRLRLEVEKIKDAEYEGGRRGGASSAIKRKPKLMPSFTVGQALAAFHGHASVAYNKKSEIWNNDALYSEFFNEKTTGAHLVFVYSLLKSIEEMKSELIEQSRSEKTLSQLQVQRLQFFRMPASVFIYANAIARSLESILGRPIDDYFKLSFNNQTSPEMAKNNWKIIINSVAPFSRNLAKAIEGGLSKNAIEEGIQDFIQQVEAMAPIQERIFTRFAKHVKTSIKR